MVRVKINHFAGKPNPYRMNSPTASIAVRGTEFSIEVDAEGDTQVVVYEGAVEVASLADPDRRVLIEAGRGVLVQAGQDFHLIGAIPPPPGNRDAGRPQRPAGTGQTACNWPMPARRRAPTDRSSPVPALRHRPPQGPVPQAGRSAVRTPTTIATIRRAPAPAPTTATSRVSPTSAQVPFLFRFNAFPEAHLDSLENPAYATEFRSAEGRLFVLPTFRGARTLQEYQSAFGPGGQPAQRLQHLTAGLLLRAGRGLHLRRQRLDFARRQHDADRGAGLRARLAGSQSAVFVPDQRQFQRHLLLRRPGGGTPLRRQQFRRGTGHAEGNRFHLQRGQRSPWDTAAAN